jgi:hypothetical protein
MSLKEKARKVFKGLDDDDYNILRFFCEEGPTSKYKASRYFDGETEKKPIKKIARATIYRKIQNLKEKQFLKVVGHEKFERGSLKSDVEILSVETFKGGYAVFGSGVDPAKIFEEPRSEDSMIKKTASIERQFDFANNSFDSLIELGIDLTERKGSFPDMAYLINTALLIRRPQYIAKLMEQHGVPGDIKKAIKNFTTLTKFLREDFRKGVEKTE